MTARKQQTKPEPAVVTAFVLTPPKWGDDAAGAVAHLGGDFAHQLFALHDLILLGADPDLTSLIAHQLAETAEAMAATIGEGRPLEVDSQITGSLSRLMEAAQLVKTKAVDKGFECKTDKGVGFTVLRYTMPTLTDAIAHAALSLGNEAEWRWIGDQESRVLGCEALVERDRAERRLREAEARRGGRA